MIKIIAKTFVGTAAIALVATAVISAPAQTPHSTPHPMVKVSPRVAEPMPPTPPMPSGDRFERSIKVDSGINLSLCVTQGSVKINGWNRNELRVFVDDGSAFAFKVQQKSLKTGDPVWIAVMGTQSKSRRTLATECIWGGEIEIDLPTGATVNIRGQETTTFIDSIKKAGINTIGGNISLRNIAGGISATAGQGDVTVEESQGAMILESTTGNITVFEASPSEIGDTFKAKTNSGVITLQRIEYRQVDASSISGSLFFAGEILSGGSYRLNTTTGSIRLTLPATSSCMVSAFFTAGNFSSEIPIKTITEDLYPAIKRVNGKMGSGDATLRLTSNVGIISIKKQ